MASYVFSFCFPESITNTTSSIVMDDSAGGVEVERRGERKG
jgi:hypothetical protein